MKKIFLFAAVAMLALVGCEKQNQSSLDFEQVQQSAKISGTLVYFADKAGAATVETPIANQRIFFQVAGNQFANGANGSKQFEATTGADGSFEIVVPTGAKTINGQLKTDVIVLGEGANRIFLDETSKNITLVAGDAKVEKRIATINQTLTACQGTATVKGNVQYNAGYVEKDGAKEDGLVAAPAGTKVTITVAYDDAVKALITATEADGTYSYEVPVPAAGSLPIEVKVAQFAGKYTGDFNNGLLTVDAIFDATPVTGINATDGEVTKVADIVATPIDLEMPTTKNTKVKVKGEWLVEAEVFEYGTGDEAKKINKLDKGTKKYTPELNGGAFELILTNTDNGQSIIYDLKVDENGKFETEVAIYDSWDFSDVEVTTRVKKFVNSEFTHYYMKYYKSPSTSKAESEWDPVASPGKWQDWTDKDNFTNQYGTQSCEGTYEAKEQTPVKLDEFFATKVDNTLTFKMSPDAKEALIGVGTAEIDKMKDKDGNEYTIYGGGIDKF